MAFAAPQRFRAPNGASLMLPPEVAGSFVGLEPDVPAIPPPTPAAALAPPPAAPPGVDPGARLPPPLAPSAAPMPDLAAPPPPAPPVDASPPTPAASAKQPQSGAVQAAPRASAGPSGQDELRAGGYAPVLDQQREALALERQAGQEQVAADRRAGEAEAKALADSMAREDAREAERARAQQQTLAQIAQRSAAIDGEIDRISKMKIDAGVRRPVLGAIGLAMGALGAALAGKTDGSNTALDIMQRQIETNVQRQLQEREAAVRAVGLKKDQIANLRNQLTDTNALYDGLAAAETRRTRTEIARLAALSKSDAAKANLLKLDAVLEGKEAEYLGNAKDKQFAFDDREKQRKEQERANRVAEQQRSMSIFEQRAGRLEQTRQFNEGMGFKRYELEQNLKLAREKEANDLKVAMAKGKGEKLAEASKLVAERGIRDPATMEVLVNATGRKLMDQAKQLEQQAEKMRASKNVDSRREAEKFATRAAELRAEAQNEHAALGRNVASAEAIGKSLADTQTALGLIDTIKADARKAGKQILNANELESRLGTNLEILKLQLKEAWRLGTLDDGTVLYLNTVTGKDPSKLTTAGMFGALGIGSSSAEQTVTKLDTIAKSLETARYNELRQLGASGFRFKRDDEAERSEVKATTRLLDEKTPTERAAGETRGAGGQLVEAALQPVGTTILESARSQTAPDGGTPTDRRRRAAEERTSAKYPGLSPEQEKPMDELLAQARQEGEAGARARAQLVEAAASTAASRPEVSNAVLNVLRGEAPELYQQAVAALPREQRELREGLATAALQQQPVRELEARAGTGDRTAITELLRRMPTDQQAASAVSRLLPTIQKLSDAAVR